MAGLYIHIPFCQSRCVYCDFYSTTSLQERSRFVNALCKELELKRDLLATKRRDLPVIETIYLGGGTPSLLSIAQLTQIFETIEKCYVSPFTCSEVTLEANPDDISPSFAEHLSQLGINRVSLGVQSFDDEQLQELGRRHNAREATQAVETLRKAGLDNLSIDLIYGLPFGKRDSLERSLREAIALAPSHISAYALTYEPNTHLHLLKAKGIVEEKSEEIVIDEYKQVVDRLAHAGYRQYEVSNYALWGMEAKHNSAYWDRVPYLGFGPAAHSFLSDERILEERGTNQREKEVRFANYSSLASYYDALEQDKLPLEFVEELTPQDRYNETLMLGLRTRQGVNLDKLGVALGEGYQKKLLEAAQGYINRGLLWRKGDFLAPTEEGFLLIDGIISSLFVA